MKRLACSHGPYLDLAAARLAPRFRWDAERLQPLLDQAHQAREQLLERIRGLETPLAQEAVSALLGRESLGTAAIEGEQLDPGQVPAVRC